MRVIPPLDVLRLFVLKSRSLVVFDDDINYAHSPFPYDKHFFDDLRPDQVPRFLRCVTSPWKLPVQFMDVDKLVALQNRVHVEKVESLRSNPTPNLPVVVRIRKKGPNWIADGLHRLTADWLDHRDFTPVRYADLSDKTISVEPVPGTSPVDDHAEHSVFDNGHAS